MYTNSYDQCMRCMIAALFDKCRTHTYYRDVYPCADSKRIDGGISSDTQDIE